jgi:hypothetical protein
MSIYIFLYIKFSKRFFLFTFPTDAKLSLSFKIMSDRSEGYLQVRLDKSDLASFEQQS